MRGTLPQMITLTEPQRRNPPENHLRPREHGERLSQETMRGAYEAADPAVDALFEVEFQVHTHADLRRKDEEEGDRGAGVRVVGAELAAAVEVSEEVAYDGEGCREDLGGDVPAALYHLCMC